MVMPFTGQQLGSLNYVCGENFASLRKRASIHLMNNHDAPLTQPEKEWCQWVVFIPSKLNGRIPLKGPALRRKVLKTLRRRKHFPGMF